MVCIKLLFASMVLRFHYIVASLSFLVQIVQLRCMEEEVQWMGGPAETEGQRPVSSL